MEFSVVINTRDHPEELRACLAAMGTQMFDRTCWEVVVVDDGSSDDASEAVVREFVGPPEVRYLRIAPTGRSGARNAGIQAARGKYILFIGDDIIAKGDLISQHWAMHQMWPRAAVIGLRTEESKVPSPVFGEMWDNCYYSLIADFHNATFQFFFTCNVSVERQALLDVGGFDENFVKYGWEDHDLGLRLERSGVRMVFDPFARAIHRHPGVTYESLWRREYEIGFSGAYYFAKWPDEPLVQDKKFWQGRMEDVQPGPMWRKHLGAWALRVMERVYPNRRLLRMLYQRLAIAHRLQGLRDGVEYYRGGLEKRDGRDGQEGRNGHD